ncbi:CAMK protein kinase [Aphanomyces invadans]|uniref:CAMK protein kinase n=1 Tax=Aphanomyces invadans TaxID=157072 RepID=A0A024ULX0_9STRA|nr:CAMK protein kinase [Aphanomyces invadans]ETW07299.1 CAMK protein kinase [Aphanomyces invadans]|eukprot:XP_008863392.1 CAMK protein kinase [Aphanomyces invadans]
MPPLSSSYALVQQLNAEGNSNIFLYKHIPSNDVVLVKTIQVAAASLDKLTGDTAAFNEMHINNIINKHRHDGIVSMRDGFVANGALHLVFDYSAGGDLLTLMTKKFSASWAEAHAIAIFQQVVSAVNHLHGLEIAHGDISLENIVITDQRDAPISVKLCDFGLAIVHDVTRYTGVGKLYYMSPEMHLRRPYNAQASDLWALGILLFMLLTGRPLFEKATMLDPTFHRFFHAQASDPSTGIKAVLDASPHSSTSTLTPDAVELITRLLRPRPADRLSAAQVLLHPLLKCKPRPFIPTKLTRQRRAMSSPAPRHCHCSRAPVLPRLPVSYFKSITTTM